MIIIPDSTSIGGLDYLGQGRRRRRHGSPPERGAYKTVPDVVALEPLPGAPQEVTLPQDELPGWDPAAKYAYRRRPEVEYQAPRGHRGRTNRFQKEADIDFEKVTDEPYNRRQDSTFTAKTTPIKREFAILPDLRPEGDLELPSYADNEDNEDMNGFGADFVRVPADVSIDELERRFDRMQGLGFDPITIATTAAALAKKAKKMKSKAKALKAKKFGDKPSAPAPVPAPPQPETKPFPWMWVGIAGAGVLVLGGVILMARR